MGSGRTGRLTAQQRRELWARWKAGETMVEIGRKKRGHSPLNLMIRPLIQLFRNVKMVSVPVFSECPRFFEVNSQALADQAMSNASGNIAAISDRIDSAIQTEVFNPVANNFRNEGATSVTHALRQNAVGESGCRVGDC